MLKKIVLILASVLCSISLIVNVDATQLSDYQTFENHKKYFNFETGTYVDQIDYSRTTSLTSAVRFETNIYTSSGNSVGAIVFEPFTELQMYQANIIGANYILEHSLTFENESDNIPTNAYNCHYFAWCSDWCTNEYWVNDPMPFINDHSTISVQKENVQVGDIVVYWSEGDPVHSAVVYAIEQGEIICQSKWGPFGLYIHDLDDVLGSYNDSLPGDVLGVNETYYRYSHPDHEHSLYISSQTVNNRTIRCGETACTYYAVCSHPCTFNALNVSEHTVNCSAGGFVLTELHNNNFEQSNSLYYHSSQCADCSYIGYEEHAWISVGSTYQCTVCGMTSSIIPGQMRYLSNDELKMLLFSLSDEELQDFLLALNDSDKKRLENILESNNEVTE